VITVKKEKLLQAVKYVAQKYAETTS